MDKLNSKVGIIVPTMNRPDFVIRLLNYYASLNCRYTVYIGDSSNQENSAIIQSEVKKLRDKLKIDYQIFHDGDGVKCIIKLLSTVKEKYVTLIGDDDYNVPDTIYACAEFLENNPDYETAIGKQVTIRVEGNQAYGKLTGIHDYQRYSIEDETASERLFSHLGKHLNTIVAAVLPTRHMLKYFQDSDDIKDLIFRGEIIPCSLMAIAGKSKVLDKLGIVRQIHIGNIKNDDVFDEITNQNWPESYALAKKILVAALTEKDKISQLKAEEAVKEAFWANLNNLLTLFYPQHLAIVSTPTLHKTDSKTKIRTKIAAKFPFLKHAYRKFIRPIFTDKQQLHYEVLQPDSKYYNDFWPIVKSLIKS